MVQKDQKNQLSQNLINSFGNTSFIRELIERIHGPGLITNITVEECTKFMIYQNKVSNLTWEGFTQRMKKRRVKYLFSFSEACVRAVALSQNYNSSAGYQEIIILFNLQDNSDLFECESLRVVLSPNGNTLTRGGIEISISGIPKNEKIYYIKSR